jgi:hypothetical protein
MLFVLREIVGEKTILFQMFLPQLEILQDI